MERLLTEYQSYEPEYIQIQRDQIFSLEREMLNDIEDEIGNMGKVSNVGLKDTIQRLSAEMKALTRQNVIAKTELSCWSDELNQIVYYNLREDLRASYPFTKLDLAKSKIQAHHKWELLTQYHETLSLLNCRLGIACWWGRSDFSIGAYQQYTKDDTIYFILGVEQEDYMLGPITIWEPNNIDWSITEGYIERRGSETWWILPNRESEKEIVLKGSLHHLNLETISSSIRIVL